ncbi:MAG: hypothetical protein A2887_04050 [Alphaproteobacteria bacterium RIFCSPLOWO2_01_FULL_40_26]|nr:MAG: hypothetical protein A3D15_00125 [Alphaproteobacteria bacterium RIFCSPHIGHO2_02_FULL_40_34]OFW95379.1 MAG: hypothetical protein A2887_04050 [Alphaproteobacteria bacterium RIFCSPLOWO2_01_FULL_40_26]OFX09275.1 MAG: hypothetical protein A3H30_00830 [Alphaproteobacteria bacterium RIFCSPLOWO2_02_FULL_40_19]OFX10813.1 MAG: hypothetical protein A3G22_05400 [Alphaproteobacteria bacterium RIFCSPLOWO2_12_FULL_40_11]
MEFVSQKSSVLAYARPPPFSKEVRKTLFEKEGGIARSAMTGDFWEINFELEFVSHKSSGASRHLLFQRRLGKPSLKKRVASHVSAMTGDLGEANSNPKFISINPPALRATSFFKGGFLM